MLRRLEHLLEPTARTPTPPPNAGLSRFYWHFVRQERWLVVALFAVGGLVAVLDLALPTFIGRVVALVSSHAPGTLLRDAWPQLVLMAAVLLIARPAMFLADRVLVNQIVNPGLSNMIRWQNHWHVVRQSWTFFQNDFAGRIANRVLQTGPALRESVVMAFDAVWYIIVYGTSATAADGLASTGGWPVPMLVWFVAYAAMLRWFVPRLRERSRRVSEMRCQLTGRVVDSYTNILTVKLFARARDEDAFVREAVDEHTAAFRDQTRMITGYTITLNVMNAMLIVSTAGLAIWLWSIGRIAVGAVATAMPLAWQLSNIAGWVARSVTSVFENIGTVQDGMRSIDVPRQMPDAPDATRTGGDARRDPLRARAFRLRPPAIQRATTAVLHGIDLVIAPGRARRPGRPVGRRQIDAGQPAAALLRPGERPHPDRRPGHRRRHPGEPARADRHGDAGHLAAAPLDPRQHPLWPARRRPTR